MKSRTAFLTILLLLPAASGCHVFPKSSQEKREPSPHHFPPMPRKLFSGLQSRKS